MNMTEKPKRVLVVDDNRDAATSLSFLLSSAGFQVETSFDGRSALETANRFRPQACVLDINMPGMNGYELAQHLRKCVAAQPLILATITGTDDDDHLDRAADAGFDLHFSKPADIVEVTEQIEDCLNRNKSHSNPQKDTYLVY